MATLTATATPSAPLFPRRRFTVAEYEKLGEAGILTEDDRVELIEGDIISMSPIGVLHSETVDLSADTLRARLQGRARIKVQNPVGLSDDTEPVPDLTVCLPRRYRDHHPAPEDIFLLIEVADTTLERDRAKLRIYARSGVREAWLVNLPAGRIEVHREPSPDGYRLVLHVAPGETLTLDAFPGVEIPASEILR